MQIIRHTLVIVLVVTFFAVASANVLGDICSTPDRMNGICTILTSCKPLLAMVRAGRVSKKKHLINSLCTKKRINNKPVVCCPNDPPTRFNPEYLINSEICGFSAVPRIFGGRIAKFEQFPWLTVLKYKLKKREGQYEFRCGGSLISERYVLTAAHCVNEYLVAVHLGEHDLTTNPDCYKNMITNRDVCAQPVQVINIEKKIIHSNYNVSRLLANDIALLRLAKPADFSTDAVRPICLPTRGDLQETPKMLTVAGWGRSENALDPMSNVPLYVQIPLVSQARCSAIQEFEPFINDNILCAGGTNNQDSCDGDSGGPLFALCAVNNTSRSFQFGVVSFGIKNCGKPGYPAIYTRVTSYMDWIMNNIKP